MQGSIGRRITVPGWHGQKSKPYSNPSNTKKRKKKKNEPHSSFWP
jgi:hypothetical protein